MGLFDLSDEEWVIIEPHFPKAGRGPARQDVKLHPRMTPF